MKQKKTVRIGLRIKIFVLFMLCAGFILFVFIKQFNPFYESTIMKKYIDVANSVADLTTLVLDGSKIEEYCKTGITDEQYYIWEEQLLHIKLSSKVNYLYVIQFQDDNYLKYIYDVAPEGERESVASFGEIYSYEEEIYSSALEVLETGQLSNNLEITKSALGYLASAYAPIKNKDGEVIAVVGVDIDMNDITKEKEQQLIRFTKVNLCAIIGSFCILLLIIQLSVINPIRILKHNVTELANGKLGIQTPVKGRNEISDITRVFNDMSTSIEGHIKEMEELNRAYYKFVPSKVFDILQKQSVTKVKLGDQSNTNLTVMYVNTDGFQQAILKMSNDEIFIYLNELFQYSVPMITKTQGVIEHFENAGFTAFYIENCESALFAAISILQQINLHNQKDFFISRQDAFLRFGIAYGQIKIGVVGYVERMSTVTISEQCTITQFLYKIAAKYYSHILITATAANQIENFEEKYHFRLIGFIYINSLQRLEKIYDVFDGDEENSLEMKAQTKELFEQGVNLFCVKQFAEARLIFIKLLKEFRKDSAAKEYLYLCNQYYKRQDVQNINIAIEIL